MTMTEQEARSEAEKLMDYGRGFAYACIKQQKYAANEADEVRDLIAAALLSTYQRSREDGIREAIKAVNENEVHKSELAEEQQVSDVAAILSLLPNKE